jgi:hypothetical protein
MSLAIDHFGWFRMAYHPSLYGEAEGALLPAGRVTPIAKFHRRSMLPVMDKKEINSPRLTANFLFWICGVGGLLLAYLLAHYVWHVF